MQEAPVVQTALGSVRGQVTYVKDAAQPVYTYLGIPYAQPPVGKLRFQRPEPVQPWEGVRDATKPGAFCPQPVAMMKALFHPAIVSRDDTSEDCLYLNIHTPGVATNDKRPVMFYIHGGALIFGMGDLYNGTPLVTFSDVVVVTFNYRLGPLGFLSTGDEACPGNMGLFDQLEALKWVNKHISNFGGDPDNVTIFGLSAGSMSVEAMQLTSLANGLYNKAIGKSASLLIPNFVLSKEEGRNNAFILGRRVGCESEDSGVLMEHLRQKPIEEITAVQTQLFMENVGFSMAVDGVYLTKFPGELYERNEYNKVPLMVGFTDKEGLYFLMKQCPAAYQDTFSVEEAMIFMKKFSENFFPTGLEEVLKVVEKEYFPEDESQQDANIVKSRLCDAMGDMLVNAPVCRWIDYHAKGAPTFMYVYTHRPSYSPFLASIPGATHGDDAALAWGDPFVENSIIDRKEPYTKEEEILSRKLIQYLTNFAKTGNPNGEDLVEWPTFDVTNRKYLELSTSPTVKQNSNRDKMALWNSSIPEMLQNLK